MKTRALLTFFLVLVFSFLDLLLAAPAYSLDYKILFLGDTSFGESYQIYCKKMGIDFDLKERGYDDPLQNFKQLLLQSNLVIANLETPITDLKKSPFKRNKKFIHWADVTETPKYLKKYNIGVVSLANNHTMDFGLAGLKQTLEILDQHNIIGMGAGLNEEEAERPFQKKIKAGKQTLNLFVLSAYQFNEKYDQLFDFYAKDNNGGINKLSIKKISEQIKKIKESVPNSFIVVFVHWGKNYRWKTEKQTEWGHQLIDAGADLIVGHGAHIMQEVEKYKHRWILYNLGNFIFNSPGRYQKLNSPPYSLVAQFILKEKEGKVTKAMRLYPILTDNLKTDFRGRFLTEGEFKQSFNLLLKKSTDIYWYQKLLNNFFNIYLFDSKEFKKEIQTGEDAIGRFLQFES